MSTYSYLLSSFSYAALFLLGFWILKKHTSGFTFLFAASFSLIWSAYASYSLLYDDFLSISSILALESLRNLSWYTYLLVLITCIRHENSYLFLLRSRYSMAIVVFTLGSFVVEVAPIVQQMFQHWITVDLRLFLHMLQAIIGLILVEQLYRNSPAEQRWSIKFICLALGSIFIFDFVIYAKAVMFLKLDYELWDIRGFIHALVVPLLIIGLNRLKNQTKAFYLSRKMVFHSATILLTGAYLFVMAMFGYYIKHFGGQWGYQVQIIFIFLALIILFILLFSGKIRALIKVFLNKHFVHYRYDYREQWIKISQTLAEVDSYANLSAFIIRILGSIVDSSSGALWLKNEQGHYYLAEQNNLGFEAQTLIFKDDPLIVFFTEKHWVIDLFEYNNEPRVYNDLKLDYWLDEQKQVWMIVPLYQHLGLQGFVVLCKAQVPRKLNWEDHDVLRTAGMQLANALVMHQNSEKLSVAKQFEAYNRLSAFVVHDLKNVIAQLSLISTNAKKHKTNPVFIDDALETVDNSVNKMQHLVQQLKKGHTQDNRQQIDLCQILVKVVKQLQNIEPLPQFNSSLDSCFFMAEEQKIASVFTHIIQNAQQATEKDAKVIITLSADEKQIIIEISDEGSGMDEKFISERLFKPFDTTKGNAGMGIGVYEARSYILEYGGALVVNSDLGKGSCFTILLPRN